MKKTILLVLFLCVVMDSVVAQTSAGKPTARPLVFGSNGSLKKPVRLPDDVLDLLLADVSQDQYTQGAIREHPQKDRNDYFSAAQVHLENFRETDYVIEGSFPLNGADAGWFWVVRTKAGAKPTIVLSTSTGELELLQSWHFGFRDIRTIWIMGPSHVEKYFQFNGVNYVLARTVDKSK